jgi:hypothetical protein
MFSNVKGSLVHAFKLWMLVCELKVDLCATFHLQWIYSLNKIMDKFSFGTIVYIYC